VIYNAASFRQHPSLQSAFIVGAGLMAAVLMIVACAVNVMALAASGFT